MMQFKKKKRKKFKTKKKCSKDIFLGRKRGFVIKVGHVLSSFAEFIPLGNSSLTSGNEG